MSNYDFELDLYSKNTMSVIISWIKDNSTVLEIGSANGRLTKYLAEEKKCEVVIVEMDEDAGKNASKYAVESFMGETSGDVEKYIWLQSEKKFDYIIFADVLEHLHHPEKVLKRCKEVLKSNGRYLISIPNISHNSIIIDLFNDKFVYDNVGLLDKTHVHFFTNTTFQSMIHNLDLYIAEQEIIYSRVGNNEISNTYNDVPSFVSDALRMRSEGSAYQYVFNLSMQMMDESNIGFEPFYLDLKQQFESECFYLNEGEMEFSQDKKLSTIYYKDSHVIVKYEFPKLESVFKIRWDPLEYSCVLIIHECVAKVNNNTIVPLKISSHNADFTDEQLFVFMGNDPNIVFQENNKIEAVRIEFTILSYKIDEKKYDEILDFLNGQLNEKKKLHSSAIEMKEENKKYIKEIEEIKLVNIELRNKNKNKNIELLKLSAQLEQKNKKIKKFNELLKYILDNPLKMLCRKINKKIKGWIKRWT